MPSTIDSLAPIRAIMDKCLELGEVTIVVDSKSRMTRVRQQVYEARSLDREQSRATYPLEDERYDTSPYDRIAVQVRPMEDGERFAVRLYMTATGVAGIIEVLGPDGLPIKLG